MKKLYLFLLCGLFCTANLNAQTWEIGVPANPGGVSSVTATLNDSTLTVSGTGAMFNWDWSNSPPWHDVRGSIKTVIIEDGVTTIGSNAFANSGTLMSVTIPNSVTTIGSTAFAWCFNLTSITIPESVTLIREGAFRGCTALISIEVEENNPNFSSINGVLFNKSQTLLIQYPAGKQGNYIIPENVTLVVMR